MRLNLGCGRVTFPLKIGGDGFSHLVQYLPESAYTEDWVNVDWAKLDGVNETTDLFSYPWVRSSNGSPYNDETVDEIWCSHIIEHIPHVARFNAGIGYYPEMEAAANRNGWHGFWAEAYRIMKPGAVMHVLAPYAFHRGGVSDPTHTRLITPITFSYLLPNPDAPFDYQIPYSFEAVDNAVVKYNHDISEENLRKSDYMVNVIQEVYIQLRKVNAS